MPLKHGMVLKVGEGNRKKVLMVTDSTKLFESRVLPMRGNFHFDI